MRNVRRELERELRGGVSEEEWADLVNDLYVQEVLAGLVPIAALADRVRRLRRVYGQRTPVLDEQRLALRSAEAVSARIDALSAIYAHWVDSDDTGVRWFRTHELVDHGSAAFRAYIDGNGPYPDFELLNSADVADWVLERRRRDAPDGDGDEHVRKLISQTAFGEKDRVKHLWYLAERNERILTVDARGTLGKLAVLAEQLSDRYRWRPSEASMFVLTGRVPEVQVYVGSASIRYGEGAATTRVTMELDPSLTPQQVAGIYGRLRASISPAGPPRALSAKHYSLARHVGPHVRLYLDHPGSVRRPGRRPRVGVSGLATFVEPVGGHTWQTLCRSWNDQHREERTSTGGGWRYDAVRNFNRDAKDALLRLLYPEWKRPDEPPRPKE